MEELTELRINGIRDIAKQLEEADWTVRTEPLVNGLQPDLVATQGDHTVVIELKLGEGSVPVSSLVYMTRLQASLQQILSAAKGDQVVECVLVTNQAVTDAVRETAADVHVKIVEVHPSSAADLASQVSGRVTSGLDIG